MKHKINSDSLTGKMLKDLLSGLVVGAYLILLLYLGSKNQLEQYFFNNDTGEAMLAEELGEYARKNQIRVTDANELIPWIENKGICEFKIARDGWLLFDASYPGVILPGRKALPNSRFRAYYHVAFADGDAAVYISTGYEIKYYRMLLALSVASGFAACLGIVISGMQKNVAYIQRLEQEVDAIRLGNLKGTVTVTGTDELGQLACGLDQMRSQLYEKEQMEKDLRMAQEKLVLGMSHDLRTPLTGLLAYMEVLKKLEAEGRPSREYIDKSYNKILQIKHLSDQMFEYFFIDSHQDAAPEPPEELKSVIGDYLSELCAMLDCAGFSVDTGMLLWESAKIQVNPDFLGRIVNNIFSNLEKYGDKQQNVKIWILYEPNRAGIAIENGMALPGQYVEGTGIGMKNVSLMMGLMGGTVETGMTGDNYRVVLYFPLCDRSL